MEEQFHLSATAPMTESEKKTQRALTETMEVPMATQITDVTIYPYNGGGNLKAFAQITLNDDFIVRGVKVFDGEHGLFASFPNNERNGEYYDVCFPITSSLRQRINEEVIIKYNSDGKIEEKIFAE
jgi:stage V sporulation protein G